MGLNVSLNMSELKEDIDDLDKLFTFSPPGVQTIWKDPNHKYHEGDKVYYYESDWCEFGPIELIVITYFGFAGKPNTYLCVNKKGIVYFALEADLKTEAELR